MTSWTAIIPVRSLTDGKSRLQDTSLNPADLTAAFLTDVITATRGATSIDRTLVVSPSHDVADLAAQLSCEVHREAGVAGINQAIADARGTLPPERPVIAILGDAPCLTPEALQTVIETASAHRTSFVPDAAGTGSTMWCSQDATDSSHFGQHSRASHRQAGAQELGGRSVSDPWVRARRDVDTAVDLWDARRIGLGRATRRVLGLT